MQRMNDVASYKEILEDLAVLRRGYAGSMGLWNGINKAIIAIETLRDRKEEVWEGDYYWRSLSIVTDDAEIDWGNFEDYLDSIYAIEDQYDNNI